jgi:Flp pilus assembly protein TadD
MPPAERCESKFVSRCFELLPKFGQAQTFTVRRSSRRPTSCERWAKQRQNRPELDVDNPAVKSNWQRHVLAATGYCELGMFDEAARALEEIDAEDKSRKEVLAARVDVYMAAQKWSLVAEVARHLVDIEPENAAWWINLAYATRRSESIDKAQALLLQARKLHPDNAIIVFNLSCYACVSGQIEQAKTHLKHAIALDSNIRELARRDEDLQTLWSWIAEST